MEGSCFPLVQIRSSLICPEGFVEGDDHALGTGPPEKRPKVMMYRTVMYQVFGLPKMSSCSLTFALRGTSLRKRKPRSAASSDQGMKKMTALTTTGGFAAALGAIQVTQ